jgi:hypothetical protein
VANPQRSLRGAVDQPSLKSGFFTDDCPDIAQGGGQARFRQAGIRTGVRRSLFCGSPRGGVMTKAPKKPRLIATTTKIDSAVAFIDQNKGTLPEALTTRDLETLNAALRFLFADLRRAWELFQASEGRGRDRRARRDVATYRPFPAAVG